VRSAVAAAPEDPMRLTIARKLAIGFGTMLFLTAGLGGAAYWGAGRTADEVSSLSEMSSDLAIAGEAIEALGGSRVAVQKVIRLRTPETINDLTAAKQAFTDALNTLDGSIQNPARRDMLKRIEQDFAQYEQDAAAVARDLISWRSTIEDTLHPMNVRVRADLFDLADQTAHRVDEPGMADLHSGIRAYLDGIISVKYYFAMQSPADADTAEQRLGRALELFRDATPVLTDPAVRARAESAIKAIEDATKIFATLKTKQNEALALVSTSLDVVGPRISATANDLTESLETSGGEAADRAAAAVGTLNTVIVSVVTGSLVLGVALAVLIGRSIVRPINSVVRSLKDIAEGDGDLTARVPVASKDEVGVLATNFNTFVANLHGIITEVRSATESVAGASAEIAASAEEMASGLTQQERQTQAVAAAVEEMSQSVREVARKSTDAAAAATQSKGAAETGGSVVGKTVSEMQAIAQEVNASAESVNALGRKGEQIGEIVAVINDIADQTNLLALNAAIEAARAGEHGRGFAVVADEVRKLAERTQEATEEVSRSIREIQSDTTSAVEKMQSGSRRVASGVELAGNAGNALREIVGSSDSMMEMVRGIAAAAEQQAGVSDEISKNVEEISAVTRQSSQGAGQASQAAADLSRQADRLQGLVGRFKI
jgi:methyl-accepting chemotaxis protein